MKVGSLFSGIGGFDLGLERAGFEIAWQAENDPYCAAVLAKHWPNIRRFGDVRKIEGRRLGKVDLLCGGFPCQDVSQAGKRDVGIAGRRSGLWGEYARLIRELRPKIVLVENVTGLAVRGLDRVLGDLASLGFDAEWECFAAAHLGAPHLRRRLFILAWDASSSAIPDTIGDCLRNFGKRLGEQCREPRAAQSGLSGKEMADAAVCGSERREEGRVGPETRSGSSGHDHDMADSDSGRSQSERLPGGSRQRGQSGERRHEFDRCELPKWPPAPDDVLAWGRVQAEAKPAICSLANGLPVDMGRGRRAALKAFGNALVPEIAEGIGREIMRCFNE